MNFVDLEQRVAQLSAPRILIVGDLIQDRYVYGEVRRISPEAPIPILAAKQSEQRLGGAGNVAWNMRSMEAEVDVIGVVGKDEWAGAMRSMLEEIGVDTDGCVLDPTRPTIQKTRLMSGVNQMLRVDWEDARPISGEASEEVLKRIPESVSRAQAVVLSDYGKGVVTPAVIAAVLESARAAGIPVLVDPKGSEYQRYAGCTLLTPNRREAEQALGRRLNGIEGVAEGASDLIEQAELDAIVITLGSQGIYFRTRDGRSGHVPATARGVFDVTGAGDTVVAQLALYLAAGLELEPAVTLANQAAAIVVGHLGTYAVTRAELRAHLTAGAMTPGKVLAPHELEAAVAGWRKAGKRIAFTNGCFDVLHYGHIDYLRFAASRGDVLLVAVNDDESVSRLKGPERPINCLEDRLQVLAALEMVDAVISFSTDTPLRLIEQVSPEALIKGQDWENLGVVGREWVEAHGGHVHLAPLVPDRSTTGIIERARRGAAEPSAPGTSSEGER